MSIAENLSRVRDSVAQACRKAGRPVDEVELMAVSKTHPVDYLLEAAEAGQTLFGENRVQEFAAKYQQLSSTGYPIEPGAAGDAQPAHPPLRVALIGHLQSNKSMLAAEYFSSIDTVDSLRLALRLDQAARTLGRRLPVLIEIKLSDEPTKEGISAEGPGLDQLLDQFSEMKQLELRGLMTVAPIDPNPDVTRACFRALRQLRDRLARKYSTLCLDTLSMGMSGDYQAAIEEGSTQVRIGTAIFGARPRMEQQRG